ncbi:hypothetical protein QQS21_002088 [Conoideocrella luteorostrata]|uniref:Uncharacterized protein n=1 Tax=Conoideocrella luteorostrata TaxID=1105319 RepID=A0AAJ0CVN3_9HYPO|nr:hypothetical protein QQS21_002088 [Conoideocrella luteorostrata]
MTQTNWIELKSAGGGFPILLEQFGAYRCFDHHESPPRIVVAIGGESKRRFFASATGQLPRCRAPTIRIQQWTPTTVLVDCELHDLTSLESVKASSQEGSCTQHPLQAFVPRACSQKRLTELSHDIYWQILTPLASIIIIFLEDIGGLSSVIEVIASWMRRSAANPTPSAPRILVLYDCNKELQVQKFTARLRARVVAFVHDLDSESGDMDEGVIFQSTHTFESLRLVSTVAATTDFLQLNIEEAFSFREGNGYAFDGEHVKYLLQAAIRHYCAGNRQQINLISASRLPNPVSDEFEMHLNYFMESCSGVDVDQAKLIASALHVDAHPPGMHRELLIISNHFLREG